MSVNKTIRCLVILKSCLTIVSALAFVMLSIPAYSQLDSCIVSYVVDGDTFYSDNNGKTDKYRLIGIDTPEIAHHGKVGQVLGNEAKEFLKSLIDSRLIYLEYDAQSHDKYGRLLVYAYLADLTMINAVMIDSGYAQLMTIPPNVKYADLLRNKLKAARNSKKGLWGLNN